MRAPGQRQGSADDERRAEDDLDPAQERFLDVDQQRLSDEPGAQAHVDEVRPPVRAVLGLDLRLMTRTQFLRMSTQLVCLAEPERRYDPVGFVPGGRVVL